MSGKAAFRGQPVMALLMLVGGWCAMRVVLWGPPFPAPPASMAEAARPLTAPSPREKTEPDLQPPPPSGPVVPPPRAPGAPLWREPTAAAVPLAHDSERLPQNPPRRAITQPRVPPGVAAGQALSLAAAFARLAVPRDLTALALRERAAPAPVPPFPSLVGDSARGTGKRWSGDAWLLLRRDTTTPVTSGRGSYGLSQAGAVVRYRIAPSSGHRPAAYVRVSTAVAKARDPEVAIGLTARPIARVPIAVAAEVRAARLDTGMAARPSVFAYSEFPPIRLPLGARGEGYAQGGYISGHFATAFVDGLVRVEREVARFGPAELRAGGGAWGGAQRGARRLDIGPGATVAVEVGGAPLRVSADWRFRVAGDANPGSGPALTVSAGF